VPPDTAIAVDWRAVSQGFFRTMRVPLLRGRDFTGADTRDAPQVVIVSQATAREFWGEADPIGRELRRADKRSWTVVGVVGEVRNTALNQEAPTLYFPTAARVFALMDVVVRVDGAPASVLPTLRRKVHDLDPELALANVRPMTEWVTASAAQPQLNAALLAGFAVVALLIAAIGIYGVIAYSVSLRTREIGIRLALGAQPSGVRRRVIGEGMVVAGAGIGAGIAGAFAIGRVLESIVFEVRVKDPATFATVAVALAIVALAACAIPARRAARVDPMVALRDD
jgi:putative ABC transport system permease protein